MWKTRGQTERTLKELAPVTILFFDRYNAEDPLFVADVARRMAAAAKNGFRALVVHASDDALQRVRETYDALPSDSEQARDVLERAVRLTNQTITRRLIDEGVAAVSIQGSDRGLLRPAGSGGITIERADWLERTVHLGGVPVVSPLALDADRRSAAAEAAVVLDAIVEKIAENWTVTLVYFTTNRKSVLFDRDGKRLESVARDALRGLEGLPVPVDAGVVAAAAATVVVTNSAGLAADGTISGTRII